ncbi:KEX1 Pheromone-processing carboxypeptidase KEX1 [Candida maltosa Xu316]
MLYLSIFTILIHALFSLAIPPKEGSDSTPNKKYLVTELPGLYQNFKPNDIPLMFAGQLEIEAETNTHYFFWKFTDTNNIDKNSQVTNRTIFWLNGGPGCSSMDGALLETGPFRINDKKEVVNNGGSWHKMGHIVYVDQPGGTGFSFTDELISDLPQVSDYFLRFMERYFELFPEDRHHEIYFAGESYAGQYIPYIANGILERNEKLKDGEEGYDLKGLLIGNGWVSPNQQSLSYLPFFQKRGLIGTGNPKWGSLLATHEECQKIVNLVDSNFNDGQVHYYEVDSSKCEKILGDLLAYTIDLNADDNHKCVNMYDYRLRDSYPSCGMNWPNELKNVAPFLRQNDVMHDLNLIDLKHWNECSGKVGRHFTARNSVPAVHLLPGIAAKVPIILFNGDNDIICNSEGVMSYLDKLEWGGSKGFTNKENEIDWVYDFEKVGYILQERNISFINIFNSSHMVPYDLPEVSRALMDLITGNYEKREAENGKMKFITYPLDYKKAEPVPEQKPEESEPEEKPIEVSNPEESSATNSTEIPNSTPSSTSVPSTSKLTRLIQLGVIVIIFWGVYILYASYKSRPSSIIKKSTSSSSSNRKKNVQWADQLDNFDDDDAFPQPAPQGIIAKTISKLTGESKKGRYAPAGEYIDDIELGEGISNNHNDDEFIIGSDIEEEQEPEQPVAGDAVGEGKK